uniref:Immunoglobulin subtype domain-containing protein n=1 Tax=Romanomermis culicivorax TaxID=13658 RepID=A0A915LBC3_ROMCU
MAMLSCQYEKEEHVQWLKDGLPIEQMDRIEMVNKDDQYHLIIRETEISDQAIFVAKFRTKQVAIRLIVEEKPREFVPSESPYCVAIGSTATLCCETPDESAVVWLKSDRKITQSDHYVMFDDRKKHYLIVNEVNFMDAAEYSVKIGWEKYSVTQLIVEGSLEERCAELQILRIPSGSTVTLESTISTTEQVTWFKNDAPLKSDGRVEIVRNRGFHRIIVHGAQIEDSGKYSILHQNVLIPVALVIVEETKRDTTELTAAAVKVREEAIIRQRDTSAAMIA